jgi:hypothetical protein
MREAGFIFRNPPVLLVGVTRLELATSCTPSPVFRS